MDGDCSVLTEAETKAKEVADKRRYDLALRLVDAKMARMDREYATTVAATREEGHHESNIP